MLNAQVNQRAAIRTGGGHPVDRLTEGMVGLTDREREVLREVAKGASAKEAAIALRIAPSTIERHIENARLKTRTRNRAHLIGFAIANRLLQLGYGVSAIALASPFEFEALL